jgi:hypothetical protein
VVEESGRTLLYVSGPINLGGTASASQSAVFKDVFQREVKRLRDLGYRVLNPLENPPRASWEEYLKLDIPMVCRADIVATLPDWELSRGARLEVFIARELLIPVIHADILRGNPLFASPSYDG